VQSSLVIWYLSDGKPGHLNQILGLITALAEITAIESFEIPVAQVKVSFFGWLTGKIKIPEDLKRDESANPDMIIGAGHGTHKALLALSKKTSAKSVLLMSPSLPLPMFDFVCAPDHDRLPFNDNCLSTEGALNRMKPGTKIADSGLILIGGPSSHAKWSSDKILSQVNELVELKEDTNWVLTTSRRTPENFIEKINPKSNLKIYNWHDTASNWLPETMATTEEIWVTPDSVSMIYEALTAEANVGIFDLKILPTRVSMGIEKLVSEKRILCFDCLKSNEKWSDNRVPLNEARRCASWLLKKLEAL
jgi:hypothetical protein